MKKQNKYDSRPIVDSNNGLKIIAEVESNANLISPKRNIDNFNKTKMILSIITVVKKIAALTLFGKTKYKNPVRMTFKGEVAVLAVHPG
jgi:hypothetical protein